MRFLFDCVFRCFHIVVVMVIVGDNGADDAAYEQCTDYFARIVFAIAFVMMGMNWIMVNHSGLMMPGLASMNNYRTAMSVVTFVHDRPLVDSAAFVHHRMSLVMGPVFMNGRAAMDGTVFVRHRLRFVMGSIFMNGRTVMVGAALMHHRLCFVLRSVFMNGRPVMAGTAFMHHRLCLVLGAAFVGHGLRFML